MLPVTLHMNTSSCISKWLGAATCALAVFVTAHAQAATVASYTPTNDPNLSPDAVDQLSNPVDLWTCAINSGAGSFSDNATYWGLWSDSAQATATTTFAGGALDVGQTVSLGFYNIYINDQIGLDLLSGGTSVFSLYFHTGGSDYQYWDNGGVKDTGVGWTYESYTPFTFTLTGADTYSATYGSQSWSGTLGNGGGDVTGLDWYSNAQSPTTSNVQIDDYSITGVPEPGQVALMTFGGAILIGWFGRRRSLFQH